MRPVFESQMPKDEKIHYNISFEAMAADAAPVVITQNEFMRRMKEMADHQRRRYEPILQPDAR